MADGTCSVEGCERPVLVKSRGLCRMHYLRWHRSGDPGPAEALLRPPLPECTIDGCDRPPKGRGLCEMHLRRLRKHGDPGPAEKLCHTSPNPPECILDDCGRIPKAHGLCEMHYVRWWKHGDPERVDQSSGNSKGDDVGYAAVHVRLRKLRGNAADHACRQCGGLAEQWAYDHADPDERQAPRRGPYSIDPAHYTPLCVPCHRKMDADHKKG